MNVKNTLHAIILAAGFGSRLKAEEGHKLLVRLGDKTLLERHIDHFKALGVKHITVVTGFKHHALEAAVLEASSGCGIHIQCAYNEDFEGSNGLSVLSGVECAQHLGTEMMMPFWLTMADHIFDPAFFTTLYERLPVLFEHKNTQGALFVDTKLDTIFDMPDATKVRLDDQGKFEAIGKELKDFNWVDTGLFWCDTGFVESLQKTRDQKGDCSTSDAVIGLSKKGLFEFPDIGQFTWQDVDTPEARQHALKLLDRWTLNT